MAATTPRSKKKKKVKVRGKNKGKILDRMKTEVMPPIAQKAKANIDLFNLVMSGSDAN